MSDIEVESNRTSASRIPRFHGKRGEDYGLWRLRLRAACRISGVWNLVENGISGSSATESSCDNSDKDKQKLNVKLEKCSGMIISALGDSPLCVVADADGGPFQMVKLLDDRYASSRTSSRIAVQTQLYRMNYQGQDMSK